MTTAFNLKVMLVLFTPKYQAVPNVLTGILFQLGTWQQATQRKSQETWSCPAVPRLYTNVENRRKARKPAEAVEAPRVKHPHLSSRQRGHHLTSIWTRWAYPMGWTCTLGKVCVFWSELNNKWHPPRLKKQFCFMKIQCVFLVSVLIEWNKMPKSGS